MAHYNLGITKILAMSGRRNTYKFDLLDKNEKLKISDVKNIKSFILTYSSLSTLKATLTMEMHEDNQYNFASDMLRMTMIVDVRGRHFEFPMGIYMMKSPDASKDGNTTSLLGDKRNVTLTSKLSKYDDDKLQNDLTVIAGTNAVNKVREILSGENEKIQPSSKTTAGDKIFKMGTSKLEVINALLDSIGYNTLTVDNLGYFISSPYVLPDNREIDFDYNDEEDQQLYPIYDDSFDIASCFNVFTGSSQINGELVNYTYVNSSSSSPISTTKLGRNICDQPKEFQDCKNRQELIDKVMSWAGDNSMKYHKCTFTTFVNPLHGYLNCIRFKNKKVNMKGIETSWTIDSKSDSMEHTIREAIYL